MTTQSADDEREARTDWRWCFECPKDAARQIDVITAELDAARLALSGVQADLATIKEQHKITQRCFAKRGEVLVQRNTALALAREEIARLSAPIGGDAMEVANWLVDAVATATQNRAFLRGDETEDKVATEAIRANGEKAISVAIARALLCEREAAEEQGWRAAVEAAAQLCEPKHKVKLNMSSGEHGRIAEASAHAARSERLRLALAVRALADQRPKGTGQP